MGAANMTRDEFAVELVKLAAALKQPLSKPLQDVFWEEFGDESLDVFRRACKRARRELDFFPSIREMRGFIGHKPPPPDPLLVRLLQPWVRKEPWPAEVEKRLPRPAPTPPSELERAIRERLLKMGETNGA